MTASLIALYNPAIILQAIQQFLFHGLLLQSDYYAMQVPIMKKELLLFQLERLTIRCQLYGYARHRWCVKCPEAVIACQTGPKRWAVNTCGEAISEDQARQWLNSKWGFEVSRIKLLGTPYYDATDWNFICFRCGPYDWLMRDGDLYQIYQ